VIALLAAKLLSGSRGHGFQHGIPSIVDPALRRVPLCFGSAHPLGDQLPCHLLSLTLYVCSGGVRTNSAVIFTRLRCAARNNDQHDELTRLSVGHQISRQTNESSSLASGSGQHRHRKFHSKIFYRRDLASDHIGSLAHLSRQNAVRDVLHTLGNVAVFA
jgi:hypothetical protein